MKDSGLRLLFLGQRVVCVQASDVKLLFLYVLFAMSSSSSSFLVLARAACAVRAESGRCQGKG